MVIENSNKKFNVYNPKMKKGSAPEYVKFSNDVH